MTKRKHALLLGSLASDRSNTGLKLGVRFTPLVLMMSEIWPITTFRCVAEFGRNRGNIGLSPAERPEDLWVHGLIRVVQWISEANAADRAKLGAAISAGLAASAKARDA